MRTARRVSAPAAATAGTQSTRSWLTPTFAWLTHTRQPNEPQPSWHKGQRRTPAAVCRLAYHHRNAITARITKGITLPAVLSSEGGTLLINCAEKLTIAPTSETRNTLDR